MLNRNMDLCAVALEGYWNDIGNIKEYHQTQFDLLTGRVKVGKRPVWSWRRTFIWKMV